MKNEIIQFMRKRDYVFVKELGQGACGKTVLLRDDMLDENFVCKKYSPYSETHRQELYSGFVREIKLLHRIYHPNVVRIFNYYLYPDQFTGYILMEYVNGDDIEEFLQANPEQTNEIFFQAIEGFRYLETNNILHRDIRPLNVLVGENGTVKIIDLGFGKQVKQPEDFDKSITLNWWCEPPSEFENSVYDFKTEIYFVGRLFENLIQEYRIEHFKYTDVLAKMCHRNPHLRISSFFEAQKMMQSNLFFEIEFSHGELSSYRHFADAIENAITKMETGIKYADDLDRIRNQLESTYRMSMLEEFLPDCATVLNTLLNGSYYYRKSGFPVSALKNFLHLLKTSTHEKQRIILANLHTRLDAITRYTPDIFDNDIPF